MKSVDVKSNAYSESSKEINHKNPKFKIGDNVRISKYKNIFGKGYTLNWLEKDLVIKKVKRITVSRTGLRYQWSRRRRNCWNILRKWIAKIKSKEFRIGKSNQEERQ